MVMKKQPGGLKRAKRRSEEVNGKPVAVEYTISVAPPLADKLTEIGWTERVKKGSVSVWAAHPADGSEVTEHKEHGAAMQVLLEKFQNPLQVAGAGPEQPEGQPSPVGTEVPSPEDPGSEGGEETAPSSDVPAAVEPELVIPPAVAEPLDETAQEEVAEAVAEAIEEMDAAAETEAILSDPAAMEAIAEELEEDPSADEDLGEGEDDAAEAEVPAVPVPSAVLRDPFAPDPGDPFADPLRHGFITPP